ncbi:hypothetical protein N750_17310 [Legionella pneumophila str. Leg01/53]|nr:hypothetical protein N750_17310 [Legionella pneumophila str. Leg01/53]ERI46731.1 hypothetical protein N749_16885 [Legionella pneumophila str. Leg01/20]
MHSELTRGIYAQGLLLSKSKNNRPARINKKKMKDMIHHLKP